MWNGYGWIVEQRYEKHKMESLKTFCIVWVFPFYLIEMIRFQYSDSYLIEDMSTENTPKTAEGLQISSSNCSKNINILLEYKSEILHTAGCTARTGFRSSDNRGCDQRLSNPHILLPTLRTHISSSSITTVQYNQAATQTDCQRAKHSCHKRHSGSSFSKQLFAFQQ